MLLKHQHRLSAECSQPLLGWKGALLVKRSRRPLRSESSKRQLSRAQRQSQEDPQGTVWHPTVLQSANWNPDMRCMLTLCCIFTGGNDGKRRKAIEDELRDPSNFLE